METKKQYLERQQQQKQQPQIKLEGEKDRPVRKIKTFVTKKNKNKFIVLRRINSQMELKAEIIKKQGKAIVDRSLRLLKKRSISVCPQLNFRRENLMEAADLIQEVNPKLSNVLCQNLIQSKKNKPKRSKRQEKEDMVEIAKRNQKRNSIVKESHRLYKEKVQQQLEYNSDKSKERQALDVLILNRNSTPSIYSDSQKSSQTKSPAHRSSSVKAIRLKNQEPKPKSKFQKHLSIQEISKSDSVENIQQIEEIKEEAKEEEEAQQNQPNSERNSQRDNNDNDNRIEEVKIEVIQPSSRGSENLTLFFPEQHPELMINHTYEHTLPMRVLNRIAKPHQRKFIQ